MVNCRCEVTLTETMETCEINSSPRIKKTHHIVAFGVKLARPASKQDSLPKVVVLQKQRYPRNVLKSSRHEKLFLS